MSLNNQIKRLLLPVTLCSVIAVGAQDIRDDLRKVNRTYDETEKLSMSVSYTMYPSRSSQDAEKIYQGFYRKDGSKLHSRLMDMETIQNANYTVVADEENKILLLSPVSQKKLPLPAQEDLDKYLSYCSSVKFTEDKTHKIYTLAFALSSVEFSEIVLYILKKENLLGKMVVYMHPSEGLVKAGYPKGQSPRMEIVYSKIKFNPKFSADEFSEKKFVETANGKLITCGKYKEYRLLNHLLNQ